MTLMKWTLLLLCLLPLMSAAAQTDYRSDSGFYSARLPEGWVSHVDDKGLHLTNDAVTMSLLELPADDPVQLIQQAFGVLEVAPGALLNATEAPLPNGTWKQEIYTDGADLRIGLAQSRDEGALVLVIQGHQADVQAVNPQILSLMTSIAFGELRLPTYAHPSTYDESEVSFGQAPYLLAGTLSTPVGAGPFPAAVIVHGSGPQNRNGQAGPLTTYRDIGSGECSVMIY